ncbi:NitT/TauT family transport system permease protein [Meinhardsimonia xiamenensis]|uniref:NitT/TauT family transport system permease protein n=1 Tax=Meinhardsimonia xiamenensis TaxID=990712 RepID=A0A1G9GD17_9RHOB|nr:ABC transporter permease [Meinhardsimonia xiamenensis]PRX31950.1 NitT/TauT family transport system permease protein [Meinhardsimonia xiamenensis]SDK98624.1 NitT/TauT family transport system permease protein [Meinhardsimonia xiamenensis]
MRRVLPVLVVTLAIVVIWYVAAVWLNSAWVIDQAARAGREPSFMDILRGTMNQDRPLLPPPHQVLAELWELTVEKRITSKRSLVYHGLVTLQATMLGFVVGAILGVALAIGIVHSRTMDLSVMPWAIISQTVPIVAIAPMIIVLSNAVGIEGRTVPKTIISAYLSYFPVLVSMVKGLRSPEREQLDLLKTYNASRWQTFVKLRLPASMPYFFASMKVAVAASLVGAIVGELPTGAIEGLGARMLIGSQFGEPMIMWTALFAAAILAALLVVAVGIVQALAARAMGQVAR